jgi:hypothetical protein
MIFFKKLFYLILFLFFIFINSFNPFNPFNIFKSHVNINNIKILKTPILNFAPQIKLHHILIIPESNNKSIYTIDFSPINQTYSLTLLKLLFAYNVPAEIRIRHIDLSKYNLSYYYIYNNLNNDNKLIDIWYNNTLENYIDSQIISDNTFKKIKNKKIKNFINKVKTWNTSMNLYTHNCQHFSQYILVNK